MVNTSASKKKRFTRIYIPTIKVTIISILLILSISHLFSKITKKDYYSNVLYTR